MHHSIIGLLNAAGTIRRIRQDAGARRTSPQALTELNDHYLRDIGFVRERTISLHRQLFWM